MERKALMFYQDWGTYSVTTLVSVNNKDYLELLEMMNKKDKYDQKWIKAIEERKDYGDEVDKHHHFTKWKGEDGIMYSILFLREWKHSDYCHIMLAHELLHAVSFVMSEMMDIVKENEALAYQHSYLMEMILKRLSKHKSKSILY